MKRLFTWMFVQDVHEDDGHDMTRFMIMITLAGLLIVCILSSWVAYDYYFPAPFKTDMQQEQEYWYGTPTPAPTSTIDPNDL